MSYTEWKIPYTPTVVPKAMLDAGFTPLLAAILAARGYDTPEKASRFLDCSDELLGDPLMMTDMPQAVMRITRAIAAGEKVAVYGDYDVDGITSSCMLTDYLRRRGLECELYIPDRIEEGYGLNTQAIEALAKKGVSLIITVDCGITTVEEVAYASSIGVDMIITDHHECREVLPDAIAVVDPKRPDCNYPSRDLAGVGVAFKLLCALEGSAHKVLEEYADLVAVGTIADVMPLVGENRVIIKAGLQKLSSAPRAGLKALMDETNMGDKRVGATGIGFTLAPRLNASGRLGQADTAVNLLLTDSPLRAAKYAANLCQLNRDRQALELDIWQEALSMLGNTVPDGPIVLAGENWHQGVIGIVASKLTDAYNVPAVMICLDEDKGKGSCRSWGGFNLFEALSACVEHLDGFGGHALAAGLTIHRENIDAFRRAMAEYYKKNPAEAVSTLEVDLCVDDPELLTMKCVEDLERLEPCGTGNPRPQLCMTGALLSELTPIGGGRHLKMRLEKFGRSYEAVFFSHTLDGLNVRPGDYVDVAFFPQINEFRSRCSVQLLVNDLRPRNTALPLDILRGSIDKAAISPSRVPDRERCARLWRRIACSRDTISGSAAAIVEELCPEMQDVTVAIGLKAFEELGLIALERNGRDLTIRRVPGVDKVDLGNSKILNMWATT